MKSIFKTIKQKICNHKFEIYYYGGFGNIFCIYKYFPDDKKLKICTKCKKIIL